MKRSLFFLLLLTALLPGAARAADVRLDMERGLPLVWAANPLPVFTVYWDDTWDADHAGLAAAGIDAATRAVVDSDYEVKLAQYGVPPLTFAGSARAVPACGAKAQRPPDAVDTLEIARFLLCETRTPGSGVPAPGLGKIYNVVLPDWAIAEQGAASVRLAQSCNGTDPALPRFGGYHFALLGFVFTVLPAACARDRDSMLALLTHEVVEAATDPLPPLYWIDMSTATEPGGLANPDNLRAVLSKGEAADICGEHHASPAQDAFMRIRYVGTRVASYWSNDDHACVVGDKRVVFVDFQAQEPVPGTVDVGDASISVEQDEAFLVGTPYQFRNPPPQPDTRYILDSGCKGEVSYPAEGNTTADATRVIKCTYVRQFLVRFEQSGLPAGTLWTVTVNGLLRIGPAAVWVTEDDNVHFAYGSIDGCTLASPASPLTVSAPLQVTTIYKCTTTYEDLVRSDVPVGYWRLGDPGRLLAADSTGHGLDGTYEAGVTGIPGAIAGDADEAAHFGGTGVVVPAYAALNLAGPVTVEAWARSSGPGSFGYLVAKSDFHGTLGYALYTGGSATLRFFVGMGGSRITPDTGFGWDGAWHHVVGVYDGVSVSLYVDKVLIASAPASGPISDSTGRGLTFGRYNDGGFAFAGDLDEVAVYDYALSEDQIHAHYNKGVFG